jgi:glycine C-acetyltransferase
LGDEDRARTVAEGLFEVGIFVVPIGYPMVARGRARIRVMVSAAHEVADLERAAAAIAHVVKGS